MTLKFSLFLNWFKNPGNTGLQVRSRHEAIYPNYPKPNSPTVITVAAELKMILLSGLNRQGFKGVYACVQSISLS